jgi:hypothetical protein
MCEYEQNISGVRADSGAWVPAALCAPLLRCAVRSLTEFSRADGSPPIASGLAAILADLSAVSASGPRRSEATTMEDVASTTAGPSHPGQNWSGNANAEMPGFSPFTGDCPSFGGHIGNGSQIETLLSVVQTADMTGITSGHIRRLPAAGRSARSR